MKKMILVLIALLTVCFTVFFSGCERQATRVAYNVSKEADNFNVTRRLTVLNVRSDKPMLELVGKFSIQGGYGRQELEIVCETSPGNYTKHFVGLTPWVTYVVEGIDPNQVNSFRYEMNFFPEMIIPFTVDRDY